MISKTERLTKAKIEYLHILYVIWTVISYYSGLFGIDAGEEPTEMKTFLMEREGISFIRFKLPSYDASTDKEYSFGEMAEIMQEYLQYCILPSDKILRPYAGGSTIYDIVESLYIDRVEETNGIWRIEVVFIDNPLAYKYVREQQWKGGIL